MRQKYREDGWCVTDGKITQFTNFNGLRSTFSSSGSTKPYQSGFSYHDWKSFYKNKVEEPTGVVPMEFFTEIK